MSNTQCVQKGQVAAARDLKPRATATGGALLVFAPPIHSSGGADLGEKLCTVPSGDRWRLVVYRDSHSRIYFDSIRGDEELWTAGGLWRELQYALRAALRRLFIDEESAGAEP